jgi:hypothetical protein
VDPASDPGIVEGFKIDQVMVGVDDLQELGPQASTED